MMRSLFARRPGVLQLARNDLSRVPMLSPIRSPQVRLQGSYRRPRYNGGGMRGGAAGGVVGLLYRWASSPRFYRDCALMGVGCAGVYVYNLEEVPVSGRRRFNWIPASLERQQGEAMYEEIAAQYRGRFLPERDPRSRMVARVLARILPHSGLAASPEEAARWRVHVIDDPHTMNAFVIPGGKVFVFSGILDVCRGDDGVAAVLGHEIAHNVARHSAEQMSRYIVLLPLALLAYVQSGDLGLYATRMLTDLVFLKPGSRQQESGARVTLTTAVMMAEACYDPSAAVAMWQRMEKLEQQAPPQFLSTHPSNHNRIAKINEWLPAAQEKREASGCGQTGSWMDEFRGTLQRPI